MRISELMIMIFVIAMFSTGFIGFYAALMNANGLTTQDFSKTNNTSATVSSLESMYNSTANAQNNTGLTGSIITFAPVNLLFGAFDAVMQAFKVPIFFYNMITDLTSKVTGLPSWVAGSLVMIIMIIIVSAIIYLIIGRPF